MDQSSSGFQQNIHFSDSLLLTATVGDLDISLTSHSHTVMSTGNGTPDLALRTISFNTAGYPFATSGNLSAAKQYWWCRVVARRNVLGAVPKATQVLHPMSPGGRSWPWFGRSAYHRKHWTSRSSLQITTWRNALCTSVIRVTGYSQEFSRSAVMLGLSLGPGSQFSFKEHLHAA